MSACIIPAGPEFQDPAGVPDSPPFLWMASPAENTTVVSATPTFSVTAGDYNLGDWIYIKWISEFPPFVELQTDKIPPPADSNPIRDPKTLSPSCFQVNRDASTHRLTAAISDHPFDGQGLLTTSSFVPPRLVSWIWEWNCPQQ